MTDLEKRAEELFKKKPLGYEMKPELEIYTDGFKDGYNKANEWHFVKDELPDYNGQFYVALKGHTETFILNYTYDEYDESKMVWLDDDDTNFDDEVYAWREKLKAPKESE